MMPSVKILVYLLLIQAIKYSSGCSPWGDDRCSYETNKLIVTSTSPFSHGFELEGAIRGYIDCKINNNGQHLSLYNVYKCFEEEAKKLCANIVFEFSLNPIQFFDNGRSYDPIVLATGMAVCNPELPHLDENCSC